jgi:hypothetical protein
MKADAFTYRVIGFDHIKKEYTLEHIKTGRIKIISREDYEYYVAEQEKNAVRAINPRG